MKIIRKKFGKRRIISFVITLLISLTAIALITTNLFIPVKYLTAYFVISNKNAANTMRVSFVDVGYGDCTIIEFPDGKTALIDGGDGSRSSEIKVLRELNRRGIKTVDFLVLTSVRRKRCGGVTEIIKYKKVNKVFAPYCPVTYITDEYRDFNAMLAAEKIESEYSEYGAGVWGDDYTLCFLSPSNHTIEGSETDIFLNNPTTENMYNASAVVWVEYEGTGVLLTGDIGLAVSDKLCYKLLLGCEMNGRVIDAQNCKIMKLPCNGANSANNSRLYETLRPEVAVLSVGQNALGLPSVNAVANAQNSVGDGFYRTDNDGTVTITVNKDGYFVQKEKK